MVQSDHANATFLPSKLELFFINVRFKVKPTIPGIMFELFDNQISINWRTRCLSKLEGLCLGRTYQCYRLVLKYMSCYDVPSRYRYTSTQNDIVVLIGELCSFGDNSFKSFFVRLKKVYSLLFQTRSFCPIEKIKSFQSKYHTQ